MPVLKITHNAGLFSNATIALQQILMYFNEHRELPELVERHKQYLYYKSNPDENLIPVLFAETADAIPHIDRVDTHHEAIQQQYANYKGLHYGDLKPFIDKYFAPSETVLSRIAELEAKYSIDYENTCGVFYRGNDKNRETKIAGYQEFIDKAKEINADKYLVLPDEAEFWDAFYFPDVYKIIETPMMPRKDSAIFYELPQNERTQHAIDFLALTIMLSKCKHLITHSGNCGYWCCLYRGHANNVYQYRNGVWL